jgi:hypothetical protein
VARIRSIKPEFWRDAKVLKLSEGAMLLFIGSWNLCDDDGRMVWDPEQVHVDLFSSKPLIDVEKLAGELVAQRMVRLYEVAGVRYYAVQKFSKHQKIDKRTASKLPPPPSSPELPSVEAKSTESPVPPHMDLEGNGSRKGEEKNSSSRPNGGTQQPPKGKKVWGTEDDHALARRIYDAVKVVAPSSKEPNWDGWANAIRLMREQDERTHEEIWAMFDWANHDTFWRVNVLAPATVRDRWTQLEAKRLNRGPTAAPPAARDYGTTGKI